MAEVNTVEAEVEMAAAMEGAAAAEVEMEEVAVKVVALVVEVDAMETTEDGVTG